MPPREALVCTQRHSDNAPSLGEPLCLDCYGWTGELWRRTMIALNRSLHALEQAHGVPLRISYGKVVEYQRRGVVHFHALIRLDRVDPAAPDAVLAPPSDITAADLAALVANAVERTVFRTPDYADTSHSWLIRWGRQLDIRPLGLPGDEITAEAVAGYLAKYAT